MTVDERLLSEAQPALDETGARAESQGATSQPIVSVCIPEPTLPAHLKDSGRGNADWSATVLEALAEQLTAANDFYHPLLSAAQELRDLRLVRSSLIELLRTVNPNSKPYSRLDQY
jgi:hypothetical protein